MEESFMIFSTDGMKYLANKVINILNSLKEVDKNDKYLSDGGHVIFKNKEHLFDPVESVRDKTVYIFCQAGTDTLAESIMLIDSVKRASAAKIILVIPSYDYARQDKRTRKNPRCCIGAKAVADALSAVAGQLLGGLITIDLHAASIETAWDTGVTHIYGTTIFKDVIQQHIKNNPQKKFKLASPDSGGTERVKALSKILNLDWVVMDKTRNISSGCVDKFLLIGDVKGFDIILFDDIIDTAGTICKGAEYLIDECGANSVIAVGTHPIMTGDALKKVEESKLELLMISDTLPVSSEIENSAKIKVVPSDVTLANVIGRLVNHESINDFNKG